MTLESRRERAEQAILDAATAIPLPLHELITRHNRALAALRAVWKSRRELQDQIAQLRAGGRELGRIVDRQCRDVLDATGLHHLIDEDGDGDWGVVWDNVAELGAARTQLVSELEAKLARHRATSTRMFDGEYKNPARKGYDIALVEVLSLLGVDATERRSR